ncbi:MAG: ABC transporter permease [Chloroflexi bacterium]|nr:ABC transporter permease [Chloroflexota bacterium]
MQGQPVAGSASATTHIGRRQKQGKLALAGRVAGSGVGLKVISFLCLVIAWAIIASFYPPTFLPGPERVFQKIIKIVLYEDFLTHAYGTVGRVMAGFVLALLGSAGVGILMGANDRLEKFLETYVLVGLTIPGLCWAVLSLMWFGISEASPVFAIFVIVSPMIAVNMWQGTKAIDKELLEMGKAFKAKRTTVVTEIVVPQLLPYLFAGARFGFALAWKVVVLSEMLGLSNGIGYMINTSFSTFSMDGVLGWTLAFTILMIVFEFAVLKPLERRFTGWRPKIAL